MSQEEKATEKMIEELSAIQHEIWSHWMKYLFGTTKTAFDRNGNHIGLAIPSGLCAGWGRQMNTMYEDLTEDEKQSDREQVYKFYNLVDPTRCVSVLKGLNDTVEKRRGMSWGEVDSLAESLHFAIYGAVRPFKKGGIFNESNESKIISKEATEKAHEVLSGLANALDLKSRGWIFEGEPNENRNVLLLLKTDEKVVAHHFHDMIFKDRQDVEIHPGSIKAWKYTTQSVKGDVVLESLSGKSYVRQPTHEETKIIVNDPLHKACEAKAVQIIERMQSVIIDVYSDQLEKSKKCATITVDFLIELNPKEIEYWNLVKSYIENFQYSKANL